MTDHYDEFDKIMEEALQKAGQVDCVASDYLDGLEYMRETLNTAIDAAKRSEG